MDPTRFLTRLALAKPGAILRLTGIVTLFLVMLAALPSVWPQHFPFLHALTVDTDPENMLPHDEPVRLFHDRMNRELAIRDMIVVGVVDDANPDGAFNVATLREVHALTEFAKTLNWPDKADPARRAGVVEADMLAPSTVDRIEQEGLGSVRFDWLMPRPPTTRAEALAVRDQALAIPMLKGTLVSEDGRALALYLPITSKDTSWRIYHALQDKIATFNSGAAYHITGLPVAEDNFGVEMFIQMGIAAPLAMVVIFLLMLFFFRKWLLVVSPMLVAMASVLCTMGLLIATGNTVHIMSSMIAIFIMPIAVLDSVHILSQFFDRYRPSDDRRATLEAVMADLAKPMLYTSLTTAVGFASLAFAPIPPVQVFGLFVAFGVMLAWLLTVTLIPAFILCIPDARLANFGLEGGQSDTSNRVLAAILRGVGGLSLRWAKPLVLLIFVGGAWAIYGLGQIKVNDNPVRWFGEDHDIRVADRELNRHFGGSYMSYLTFAPKPGDSRTGNADEVFKSPEMLAWIARLQAHLQASGDIGKSSSVVDIVKTVHRELFLGDAAQYRIPDSAAGVAQTLLTYQSSHRPQDLWHFVTPDFRRASLWVQMKSGDNLDMTRVVQTVDAFIAANPPPAALEHQWFGLNYINVVWQERMVGGMAAAFAGSFAVVLLMMTVMLRSGLWGLLAMLPLTLTIAMIYGVIGLVGKDYDMPVAVLSSLSLGLAVDFAIHFLVQARVERERAASWAEANAAMFGAPARAIVRNVLVVALGFTPLLFAPLVPYQTVGMLIAAILLLSGALTLVLLPALIQLLEPWLFPQRTSCHAVCRVLTQTTSLAAGYMVVALNFHQFLGVSWQTLVALGVALVLLAAVAHIGYEMKNLRNTQREIRA